MLYAAISKVYCLTTYSAHINAKNQTMNSGLKRYIYNITRNVKNNSFGCPIELNSTSQSQHIFLKKKMDN